MGVAVTDALEATREEYRAGRFRRFGTANPERMEIPYWKAMVRCDWEPDQASSWWFGEPSGREEGQRLWCCDRWGMSFTPLPDGRFVEIGGVFEHHYQDPDFSIYNDVVIHDGQGGIEILGYPQEVFPPTDYHSATPVGEWIYIIGNVGYPAQRRPETPVYRLHLSTGMMEKVATSGESPGWISDHADVLSGDRIRISGGVIYPAGETGSDRVHDNADIHWLDLATGVWEREEPVTRADEGR